MKVLIVFATTEGQTRKVAQYMVKSLEQAGHSAQCFDCTRHSDEPDIADFDAVILAASVHHKRYQAAFYDYVSAHKDVLQAMPVAFLSVSLAATLAGGEVDAQGYVDDFLEETGLVVDRVHLAEGAVRYYAYSSSDAMTIDLIVFKGQKKLPERDGNPEYTDWNAIDAFIASFLAETGSNGSQCG